MNITESEIQNGFNQVPYNQNESEKGVYSSCWNYGKCGNIVRSSNGRGDVVNCGTTSFDWICENNHVNEGFLVCARGIPLDCPQCILDKILGEITILEQKAADGTPLPDVPVELERYHPIKISTDEKVQQFIGNQCGVLRDLMKWSQKQDGMKIPPLKTTLVPCFLHQFEELRSTNFSTELSTLNGVQVFEWTRNNVELIIHQMNKRQKTEVYLLFGLVYCCRVLVDPPSFPGKGKKPYEKVDWVKQVRFHGGYSCLQHNRYQWDHLIVWDPYPMIATHKLSLTLANIQQLLKELKTSPSPPSRSTLKPEIIKFFIPESAKSVAFAEKEVKIWYGLPAIERKNLLPAGVQHELLKKLHCCARTSRCANADQGPSGMDYLAIVQEKFPNSTHELMLLQALEHQKVGQLKESEISLRAYEAVCPQFNQHPLYTLAKARQLLYLDGSSQHGEELLLKFARANPSAVDSWLDDGEKKFIVNEKSDANMDEGSVPMGDLRKLTECLLCLEILDQPKTLQCQHIFCKRCIREQLVHFNDDGSCIINCPLQCTTPTLLSSTGTVDDLPVAYVVKGVLDLLNAKVSCSKTSLCTASGKCMKPIVKSCCKKLMCKECFESHSCHQTDPKGLPVLFDKRSDSFHLLCDAHQADVTDVCCEDDTYLCLYCVERDTSHKEHQKNKLTEELAILKETLMRCKLENAKNVEQSFQMTTEAVKASKKTLKKVLNARIDERVSQYRSWLCGEVKENLEKEFGELCEKNLQQYSGSLSGSEYVDTMLLKPDVILAANRSAILEQGKMDVPSNWNCTKVALSKPDQNFDTDPLGRIEPTSMPTNLSEPMATLSDSFAVRMREVRPS